MPLMILQMIGNRNVQTMIQHWLLLIALKEHIDSLNNSSGINSQPILAKKIYDIYKFQIFKKITIFRNILNTRRPCLERANKF